MSEYKIAGQGETVFTDESERDQTPEERAESNHIYRDRCIARATEMLDSFDDCQLAILAVRVQKEIEKRNERRKL
jgi:hypothetical protein